MMDWDDDERFEKRARELEARVRRRHPGRKRRRKRPEAELTPEEKAYREAERRAERKLAWVRHFVIYGLVVLGILFVTRSPVAAGIVALGWGIGIWSHFFSAIVGPELRRRWIQHEVERDVQRRVSRERRVFSDEKTRSLEQLSASIAHEIRNPITAAKSLVQQMGEDPRSNENVEYAGVALQELDRVERSISHLLRYAREEEMTVRTIRLSELLEEAIETLRERLEKGGVEIQRDYDSEGEMDGDPEKMRRVFINLIGNAIDVLEEKSAPEPRIDLSVGDSLAGTEVWARIRDNGPGMDEATRTRIFQPFFTSRAGGTGLGLAISRKLVDAHGGEIELQSELGQGTEFALTFPKQLSIGAGR